MAMASIALRPSVSDDTGVPHVQPSTDVLSSCVESGSTPTSAKMLGEAHPLPQRVADVRPADRVGHARQRHVGLDLVAGQEVVERQLELRSTIPWIRSRQPSVETWGTTSAVSMR